MTVISEKKIRTPVSIKWQTVFAFVPVLNLYALLRVERYWKGVGLNFLLILVMVSVTTVIQPSDDLYLGMYFVWFFGYVIASVYFIRRWSRQWNEKAIKDLE